MEEQSQQPLFSILIAMYNNGRFFKECYESILRQTYSNWEVIIVDDCSTDDSLELMKSIIGNDLRFKIYQNERNSKCGFTKSRCVELSSGDFFGFLDPDDFLTPQALEASVKAFLENKEASLSYSNHYKFNDGDSLNKEECRKKQIPDKGSILSFVNGFEYIPFHFVSFRRSLYNETDGINSMFVRGVDYDLYTKMEEKGPFLYIDAFLYNYRVHENNLSLGFNLLKSIVWIIIAIYEACKRRKSPDFEKYVSAFLQIHFPASLHRYIVVGRVVCNPGLMFGIVKKRIKNFVKKRIS